MPIVVRRVVDEDIERAAALDQVADAALGRGRVRQVLWIRVGHVARLNGFRSDGRFHGWAEHLRIKRGTDRKHRVAQNLGFNPLRTPPPEQAVVWIDCSGVSGERRWLCSSRGITRLPGNGGALPRRR